jgi:hypothetical protein
MSKANIFFWIEILYNSGGETKKFSFMNCKAATVQKIRLVILDQGLQIPEDIASWIVIFPWQITLFTYRRQEKFFANYHSDLTKTVFDNADNENGDQKLIS